MFKVDEHKHGAYKNTNKGEVISNTHKGSLSTRLKDEDGSAKIDIYQALSFRCLNQKIL